MMHRYLRLSSIFFILIASSLTHIQRAEAVAPTITSLSNIYGVKSGGTVTVIIGTDFTGTTGVTVGGTAASINSLTDTALTITTPPSVTTGAKNVVVTNSDGSTTSTNAFTYTDAEVNCGTSGKFYITGNIVVSASSCVGTVSIPSGVTSINGCTFGNASGGNCLSVSGNAITSVTLPSSMTSLGAKAFLGATTMTSINLPEGLLTIGRDVFYQGGKFSVTIPTTVTNMDAAFYRANLTDVFFSTPSSVTGFAQDTFRAMPNLTSLVIPDGVTTLGNISVGDVAAGYLKWVSLPSTLTSVASNALGLQPLTCVANPGNSTYVTNLTMPNTPSRVTNLSDCPGPTFTAITANAGTSQGGVSRSISGTNLNTVHTVTIGGSSAVITARTTTYLTITTPAGSVGAQDIVLTTYGHTVTAASAYTNLPLSTITSLSPTSGVVSGGTAVIVTGTNLETITSATLGGVTLTKTSNTSTTYSFTTPAGTAGAKDLVLTNLNGTVTMSGAFTYFVLTSSFSTFAVAGSVNTISIRSPLLITATVAYASKITFKFAGTRIAGCISRSTPANAPFTVTCTWKPTRKGGGLLTATSVPNAGGISTGYATPIGMTVGGRTNTRQ